MSKKALELFRDNVHAEIDKLGSHIGKVLLARGASRVTRNPLLQMFHYEYGLHVGDLEALPGPKPSDPTRGLSRTKFYLRLKRAIKGQTGKRGKDTKIGIVAAGKIYCYKFVVHRLVELATLAAAQAESQNSRTIKERNVVVAQHALGTCGM